MKSKCLLFICSILVLACQKPEKPASVIKTLVDTLPINKTQNILIFTLNPNDCINCINGFKAFSTDFSAVTNSRVFIISVEREIEKNDMLKRSEIDLRPAKNKAVVWGKNSYEDVNRLAKLGPGISSVIIYNYEKDSILFAKPVREIMDENELKEKL